MVDIRMVEYTVMRNRTQTGLAVIEAEVAEGSDGVMRLPLYPRDERIIHENNLDEFKVIVNGRDGRPGGEYDISGVENEGRKQVLIVNTIFK